MEPVGFIRGMWLLGVEKRTTTSGLVPDKSSHCLVMVWGVTLSAQTSDGCQRTLLFPGVIVDIKAGLHAVKLK